MESGGVSPFPSIPASRTGTPSNLNPDGTRKTKICVYCGASPGFRPEHLEAARQLARVMAAKNIGLVYGGGTVGIMGEVAKTLVSLAGPDSVHGIIPEALVRYERDPSRYTTTTTTTTQKNESSSTTTGSTNLPIPEEKTWGRTTVVRDMHTRKQMMAQEVMAGGPGSGFIALSGGYGTVEELFETATWNQLGIHSKGVCILNINGFYDGILDWIRKSVEEGFIHGGNARILVEAKTAEDAVRALAEYKVSESVMKLSWGNE
ncbi:putative lysine decarboxylase [Echria macrotheca]|uniref:Lysine decarboxylase n=1 Tax=Echria macrotheca TaxID=438768 RepID=A0AAJ0BRN1_9PEZI|nr:putative lysine decarboxylase [Echria macrotheca]